VKRALLAVVLLASCARKPADGTPEAAVDRFLQACEEAPHDPAAAARAYALLAPSSRKNLDARAQKATAVMGRPMTAEQMLVPGFTPLRFEISKTTTDFEPDGAHATVDVVGPDPATQHARVPLEREGESWRIAIAFPP
jgi:hypothetical protein